MNTSDKMRFLCVFLLVALVALAQGSSRVGSSLGLPKTKSTDSKKKVASFSSTSLVAAGKASNAASATPAQLPDAVKLLIGAGGKIQMFCSQFGFRVRAHLFNRLKACLYLPKVPHIYVLTMADWISFLT